MKVNIFIKALFLAALTFVSVTAGAAQATASPENKPQANQQPTPYLPSVDKPNLLAQLGLARPQIQQIRRLNMERKPLMEAAQLRFRDANRLLDEAIYADQVDDSVVQERLKEVQLAQADVAKVRYMSEVAIRRILTPEQLIRFRELRQRFEQVRQTIETSRPKNNQRPGDANQPIQTNDQPVRRFIKQKQVRTIQ